MSEQWDQGQLVSILHGDRWFHPLRVLLLFSSKSGRERKEAAFLKVISKN